MISASLSVLPSHQSCFPVITTYRPIALRSQTNNKTQHQTQSTMIASILTSSRFLKRSPCGSLLLWLGLLTSLVASEAVPHFDPPGNNTVPVRPAAREHQFQYGYQFQFEFSKYSAWADFDFGLAKRGYRRRVAVSASMLTGNTPIVPVKPSPASAKLSSGLDKISTKSVFSNPIVPTPAPGVEPAQEELFTDSNANSTELVNYTAQPGAPFCLHTDPGEVHLRSRLKSDFRAHQFRLQLALNRERDLERIMAEFQKREDRLTAWEADLKLREMGFFKSVSRIGCRLPITADDCLDSMSGYNQDEGLFCECHGPCPLFAYFLSRRKSDHHLITS